MTTQPSEKSKTILFADDDEMIVEVGKAMQECLGYRVTTANSGEMALDTVSKYKDDIELIIIDLAMPGMNGTKAIECGMFFTCFR